jgi:uncharacterized protein (TIGR02246 family)
MSRKIILSSITACIALMAVSCGEPAANNAANRPANTANNASANSASSASADADIKKLMTDLGAALAKNDADAASKFYADDYHLVTPDGIDQDKNARMADMRSGSTKFDTFAYENVRVRTYGDTAVAIATVKATGVVSGRPRTGGEMMATLVFRKMGDGWKVVSGQATPITAAASANTATNSATNAANKPANSAANAPANK